MQYTILLNRDENTREAEDLEQSRFVYSIIEALELPVDEWNPNEKLSVEAKIKLRKTFSDYSIHVVDDADGGIKVFADKELIGEWYKCKYKFKKDGSHPDPKERMYIEMSVKFWTTFEEPNEE